MLCLREKGGQSVAMVRRQLSLVTWAPCYTYAISTQRPGVLLHYRNVVVCHDVLRFLIFFAKGKKVKERGRGETDVCLA